MISFYHDYCWKEGIPCGVHRFNDDSYLAGTAYKIVGDPYRKRYSVEKYVCGRFEEIVYDSALFDFRLLKPMAQHAWQKIPLDENIYFIRNTEDRVIVREEYRFEGEVCRECHAYYPGGQLISVQKIHYKKLGDAFDGVLLVDRTGRCVVRKEYRVDDVSGEFTELLSEVVDFSLR